MTKLQAGDIILYPITHKSNPLDKLIGLFEKFTGPRTKYQYGHCALWLEPGIQIEAYFPFCRVSHINPKRPKQIYKYKGLTKKQRQKIVNAGLKQVHKFYDIVQILSFNLLLIKGTEVCSGLVNIAYKSGSKILSNKKNASPDDIAANKHLVRIK
jgi:hypothetical protein